MAQTYQIPSNLQPLLDATSGRATIEWHQYLAGIQELSGRVAVNVSSLAASPTNEQIATAFNELLTALQNANLQNSS